MKKILIVGILFLLSAKVWCQEVVLNNSDRDHDQFLVISDQKEKIRLGLLILNENSDFSSFTNKANSSLEESSKYDPVAPLPEASLLYKKFDIIFAGATPHLPNTIQEKIQQLLLGKLSFRYKRTRNNMFMVNVILDGKIYETSDYRLVQSLNLEANGIGISEKSAKDASLNYILKNLKEKLN